MEEKLNKLLSAVSPLDDAAMEKARERQAQLAKPPGSLGRLEDLSVQLAGITGQVHNKMEKTHLLVFAADNGVVAEGVSSAPQSVTEDIDNLAAHGRVEVLGNDWAARSTENVRIQKGTKVQVVRIEGVKLIVTPTVS